MGFRSRQRELAELVASTSSGRLQLPDFQRGYRWSDEQVRRLLVTVAQGHPLGALLLLTTGSAHRSLQTVPLAGTVPAPDVVQPELLLLDGQHRLTSLTQALTGSGVVETEDGGPRRYFLHIPSALARPDDLHEALRSVPASDHAPELEHGYFRLSSVFSEDAIRWLSAYGEHHDEEMLSFLSGVVSPMRSYAVSTIELDERTTMAAVTTVFERINQRGASLTVFELLTARFAGDRSYADWSGAPFRLRDDWVAVRGELDDHPVLDRFGGDDFVQAVTLAATHAAPGTATRREDVLELSLADYQRWAPLVRDALRWVADFLDEQHLHVAGDLPYPRQVVPLAAIRAVLGAGADVYATRTRLRQWFWCGVLGELYDGAVERRFARDLDEVPGWATGDTTTAPDTVAAASFHLSRLRPGRAHSAAYKGSLALLMGLDAMEWVYDESFDRGHYLRLKIAAHQDDPALLGVGDDDQFFVARRAALRALVEEAMGKPVGDDA